MTSEPDWVPPGVDTKRANVARVYDYLLGGTHNFLADQDVARTLLAVEPTMREIMRANRAFLGRAVRFLVASDIRQFLDIGSGIPTESNVHQVAQEAAPGSRVVYVDMDQVAIAHSQVLLADNDITTVILGDLREPQKVLSDPATRRLIDFGEPVGLILAAVLHFIPDAEDPWRTVRILTGALPSGSYVVISHGTNEGNPAAANAMETAYNRNVPTDMNHRSREQIRRFFDGLDLVPPGLVTLPNWRPDPPGVPEGAEKIWGGLCGVARKP